MDENRSNKEQLPEMVQKLIKLYKKNKQESRHMLELYEEIRNICLVELYNYYPIRKILGEEMSGFLLYFESHLKSLLTGYDTKKAPFEVYLKRFAEFKAHNYLYSIRKKNRRDSAILKTHCEDFFKENWDGDLVETYSNSEEMFEGGNLRAIQTLRYICSKRISFQKRIFIFMCTLLPFMSINMIEHLCREFNFDVYQTLTVNELIYDQIQNSTKRDMKDIYTQKRNDYWSKIVFLQSEFASEGVSAPCEEEKEKLRNSFEMYKYRKNIANNRIKEEKNKVDYNILSRILDIPVGTISSTTYTVKNIMEAILKDEKGEEFPTIAEHGLLSIIFEAQIVSKTKTQKKVKIKHVGQLPVFKPLEVFGISIKGALRESNL